MSCRNKRESMAHTQEKEVVNKNCPWGSPDVELTRQCNVFIATLNIFSELKEIISKILKESMGTISHQIEKINQVIEIMKKNQMENLELKSTTIEMKN